MQLHTLLKSSVAKQDTDWALRNCFASWDNGIDADIIIQGIHTRMSALGQSLTGLQLQRVALNEVVINIPGRQDWLRIKEYNTSFQPMFSRYSHNANIDGRNIVVFGNIQHFNVAELDVLALWLMDNFHH